MHITLESPLQSHQALTGIYDRALSPAWPLSPVRLQSMADHTALVAWHDTTPVGIALLKPAETSAHLQLLAVDPGHQGRSIGTALLAASRRWAARQGFSRLTAGRGPGYLWQGVPEPVIPFFAARGFILEEMSLDMVCDLSAFTPCFPPGPGVSFRMAEPQDGAAVNRLLAAPDLQNWQGFYQEAVQRKNIVLLALSAGDLAGAVILEHGPMTWSLCFPGRVGGLACLGVAPAFRGRGIGRSLAARGTLLLREKGLDVSYLGWTWLEDWYGALGYRPWRRFGMMSAPLTAAGSRPFPP